jgi:hypothetical protein
MTKTKYEESSLVALVGQCKPPSSLAHPSVIVLVLPLIIIIRLAWKEMFPKIHWNQ